MVELVDIGIDSTVEILWVFLGPAGVLFVQELLQLLPAASHAHHYRVSQDAHQPPGFVVSELGIICR